MVPLSALIDFLVNLMRNDDAKTAFDENPQAELARNGLDGITAADVRDASLVMADNGIVAPRGNGPSRTTSSGNDPVREIHHTTNHYEIDKYHHSVTEVDQTLNLVSIDDRDTTVVDSFNSADTSDVDVVAIQDNSQTDIDVVQVEDSFNEEPLAGSSIDTEEPETGDPAPAESEPADGALDQPGPAEPVEEELDFGVAPVEAEPIEEEPDLDPAAEAAVI